MEPDQELLKPKLPLRSWTLLVLVLMAGIMIAVGVGVWFQWLDDLEALKNFGISIPAVAAALYFTVGLRLKNYFDGFAKDKKKNPTFAIIYASITVAAALCIGLNVIGDFAETRTVDVTAVSKHETHSSKHGDDFYAAFQDPDSVEPNILNISVRRSQYKQIVPNETQLRITYHHGLLDVRWLEPQAVKVLNARSGAANQLPLTSIQQEALAWLAAPAPVGATEERKEYWPNGALKQTEPVVNGRNHGMGHYSWDNGQHYGDIPWRDGQKDGRFKLYRADGTLEQSLSYKAGLRHGLICWYNAQGAQTQKELYVDDKWQEGAQISQDCD